MQRGRGGATPWCLPVTKFRGFSFFSGRYCYLNGMDKKLLQIVGTVHLWRTRGSLLCFIGKNLLEEGKAAASGFGTINSITEIELFSEDKPGALDHEDKDSLLLTRRLSALSQVSSDKDRAAWGNEDTEVFGWE